MPRDVGSLDRPVSKNRRRTHERSRVTRACDRCKRRKAKCEGRNPCALCRQAQTQCTFESVYTRGRAPIIEAASDVDAGINSNHGDGFASSRASSASDARHFSMPGLTSTQNELPAANDGSADVYGPRAALVQTTAPNETIPKSPQQGLHGHYIGSASGVSFLSRVQKRLTQAQSLSRPNDIFTFGDPPLPSSEIDHTFYMSLMTGRSDLQRCIERHFSFGMPTYRCLFKPTIDEWLNEFYETHGTMRDGKKAPIRIALLFLVVAHGSVYMPENQRQGLADKSVTFYHAAEKQLARETGAISLTSIQARFLQCMFLLTQSRINHCWSMLSTVIHLSLAAGLHRDKSASTSNGLSLAEAESRRRTFWCAYTLDVYLSIALGRPRLFHDEDIDIKLPLGVDDSDLLGKEIPSASDTNLKSVMFAAVAHMRLARLIAQILRQLYSVKPVSLAERIEATRLNAQALSEWKSELSHFLEASSVGYGALTVPIFQRQRSVLSLMYWHAVLLTHRPFLLSRLAGHRRDTSNTKSEDVQTDASVGDCLKAAMETVNTLNNMSQSRLMYQAFSVTPYFAFAANLVLYIYVIHRRSTSKDDCSNYNAAAEQCQHHIGQLARKGSLSERYYLLLEELRLEASRLAGPSSQHSATIDIESIDKELASGSGGNYVQQQQPTTSFDNAQEETAPYHDIFFPGSASLDGLNDPFMPNHSDWSQFASMVSSGLGNLDSFFTEDPFGI